MSRTDDTATVRVPRALLEGAERDVEALRDVLYELGVVLRALSRSGKLGALNDTAAGDRELGEAVALLAARAARSVHDEEGDRLDRLASAIARTNHDAEPTRPRSTAA